MINMRSLWILLAVSLAACSAAEDVPDGVRLKEAAVKELDGVDIGAEAALLTIAWRPDGKEIFTGGTGPDGLFVDVTDGTRLGVLPFAHGPIRSVSYSRDGKLVAIGGSENAGVWALDEQHQATALFAVTGGTSKPVSVAWSPKADVLAVAGSVTQAVTLWNGDGQFKTALTGVAGACLSPVWSADGEKVAAVCTGHHVGVWNAASGALLLDASSFTTGKLYTVSWNGAGTKLATAGADQNVYILNAVDGSVLHTLVGQPTPISAVSWHPQKDLVLSAGWDRDTNVHNHLLLWDATAGKLAGKLVDHSTGNTDVAWSPDGSWFATTSVDAVLKIRPLSVWGL
jgi:Tol biopolymer transport system component